MNRSLVGMLLIICLFGCSHIGPFSGSKPPEARIIIDGKSYETVLGTYCWGGSCVDTAGPMDLLKGKVPIKVKEGDVVSLVMDYEPKPSEFQVLQINEGVEQVIDLNTNQFTVPEEKGRYYYSYGVWWMDDEQERVSNGDAFYNFVLEVY